MRNFEYGGKTFRAWSEMPCLKTEDHPAHTWSGDFTIYGPYMCWGLPNQGPKHKKA